MTAEENAHDNNTTKVMRVRIPPPLLKKQIMYDSTEDTMKHIASVQEKMDRAIGNLKFRSLVHDLSKLESPEKEVLDEVTTRLRGLTFGTPEYYAQMEEMQVFLDHHYKMNSHHPQHYARGIDGMSLFDLLEMFCDWMAAVERHADGDIVKSIHHNAERFNMTNQLTSIFLNTLREMR